MYQLSIKQASMKMTDEFDTRFHFPSTMIVSGASGSGKTMWIYRFLQQVKQLMSEPPDRILLCYGIYQPIYQEMMNTIENMSLSEGCDQETLEHLGVFDPSIKTVLILDDLHQEMAQNELLSKLFCKFSHHANSMVIFVTQNLYHKDSAMRDTTTNCHYLVCLAQPRDKSIIACLGRQMFPGKAAYLVSAYEQATEAPHGYLIVDALPGTPSKLRLRSGVFLDETDVAWLPVYK